MMSYSCLVFHGCQRQRAEGTSRGSSIPCLSLQKAFTIACEWMSCPKPVGALCQRCPLQLLRAGKGLRAWDACGGPGIASQLIAPAACLLLRCMRHEWLTTLWATWSQKMRMCACLTMAMVMGSMRQTTRLRACGRPDKAGYMHACIVHVCSSCSCTVCTRSRRRAPGDSGTHGARRIPCSRSWGLAEAVFTN